MLLAVAPRASRGEAHDHRRRELLPIAEEYAGLLDREVDAGALDRVDRLDRAREIELAGATQPLVLDRPAGAEGQIANQRVAVRRALGPPLRGEQHLRLVIKIGRASCRERVCRYV